MTIEQEFYKCFGIIPIPYSKCTSDYCISADKPYPTICKKCPYYTVYKIDYPPITDRILLELICIYNSTYTNGYTNYSLLSERNVEKLKEQILKNCLIVRDDIKLQIQQLFKEYE